MKKTIKITVIVILLILLSLIVIAYNFSSNIVACTDIGCFSSISVITSDPIPELFVVRADQNLIFDMCDEFTAFEMSLSESHYFINKNRTNSYKSRLFITSPKNLEEFETLNFYSKEDCESEQEQIIFEVDNTEIEYTKFQPNGPKCEPTCYISTINMTSN
ncbi:MAG: hypothetical protein ACMXX6_00620 [Candidatus Woesearchaeota archaeon]